MNIMHQVLLECQLDTQKIWYRLEEKWAFYTYVKCEKRALLKAKITHLWSKIEEISTYSWYFYNLNHPFCFSNTTKHRKPTNLIIHWKIRIITLNWWIFTIFFNADLLFGRKKAWDHSNLNRFQKFFHFCNQKNNQKKNRGFPQIFENIDFYSRPLLNTNRDVFFGVVWMPILYFYI